MPTDREALQQVRDALETLAASHAWTVFGECRRSTGPIALPSEADLLARSALAAADAQLAQPVTTDTDPIAAHMELVKMLTDQCIYTNGMHWSGAPDEHPVSRARAAVEASARALVPSAEPEAVALLKRSKSALYMIGSSPESINEDRRLAASLQADIGTYLAKHTKESKHG